MNLSIREKIREAIGRALSELGVEKADFAIEHPNEAIYGDYSTNVALEAFGKQVKGFTPKDHFKLRELYGVSGSGFEASPKDLAEQIVNKLVVQKIPEIERVEIAGPGFINFYLSAEFYRNSLVEILKLENRFGESSIYAGKKILVEHSSPNLFKPFHIGHLVNNSVGEAITRIFKFSGAKVIALSYPSDVSLGIARAVWGVKNLGKEKLFGKIDLFEQMKFLGDAYVLGTREYEENSSAQAEINQINLEIYAKQNPNPSDGHGGENLDIYKKGREITLKYFEIIAKRLGSKFDGYIFESEAGDVGKRLVQENIGKVFEESEGAIIFDGEKFGLHKRVFINSAGLPIYEAKDLGLIKMKFQKYNPDLSVFITDLEQAEYFRVVLRAAEEINREWAEKSKHVPHGRLRFADGKLSSRLGNVPLAEDIISLVWEKIEAKKKEAEVIREIDSSTLDKIAISAVKLSILKSNVSQNIVFDIDKSISFDGDSGPYLQYTFARTQALLAKGKADRLKPKVSDKGVEIFEIEKILYKFPEIVERALTDCEPHHIANYLLILARGFNTMYEETKIISEDKVSSEHKLAIVKAIGIVFKNGLNLLGIEAVERM